MTTPVNVLPVAAAPESAEDDNETTEPAPTLMVTPFSFVTEATPGDEPPPSKTTTPATVAVTEIFPPPVPVTVATNNCISAYLPLGTVYAVPLADTEKVVNATGVSPPKLAISHLLLTWSIMNNDRAILAIC